MCAKTTYILSIFIGAWALTAHAESVTIARDDQAPHHFSVVIQNAVHKIYRSSRLGKAGLIEVSSYLERQQLPFPTKIIYVDKHGFKKNPPLHSLFALEEYESQRDYGYQFFHSYHSEWKTYLDGQDPYLARQDIDQKQYLNKQAIQYFGLRDDGEIDGTVDDLMLILELILSSEEPVLFHCADGQQRTGLIALILRYLQGGTWIDGNKKKVVLTGMQPGTEGMLNPAQYEYWLHNPENFLYSNIRFVEKFAQDARFLELRDTYQHSLNATPALP
ncbi:MAG: tyrosine-protein phosphatase [Zetaproteobacteria bacterium]|nr:tyrosine-protein phosphatase [Zetaproteobacteria bacterium]